MFISSIASIALGQSLTDEVRLVRTPDIHGKQVVFTYASDLWVSDADTGETRRLTSHAGMESYPKFSPDGKWIAFSGQYDGGLDVYIIPTTGGAPKRLTYEPVADFVEGWTNDGSKVAYTSGYGSHTTRMDRLWYVGTDASLPERTDLAEVSDLSFSPDGTKIAYNRAESHIFNWRRYRGGTQGKISFWDFKTKSYSELPTGTEQNYFPMWIGDHVYYISDKNQNTLNLYKHNVASKKTEQITKFDDADIRWPETDGKSIVFERNLRLFVMDIATGQIRQLDPRITGDHLSMRPRYVNLSNQITGFELSPTGKRVMVAARGEVFSVPATNGDTRNVTDSDGVKEFNPQWSYDGEFVYYLTDRSGEIQLVRRPQMGGNETVINVPKSIKIADYRLSPDGEQAVISNIDFSVYVLNLKTGQTDLVFKDEASPRMAEWSPDGKWLVYAQTLPNLQSNVRLYNVAQKKAYQVTSGTFSDASPTFDGTGKYLYLVSGRDYASGIGLLGPHLEQGDIQRVYVLPLGKDAKDPFQRPGDEEPIQKAGGEPQPIPAPAQGEVVIDTEKMERRLLPLPFPVGSYPAVVGANNGVLVATNEGWVKFDMGARAVFPVLPALANISLNKDRTKLAYQGGSTIGIIDIRPGNRFGDGAVALNRVGRIIDPAKEYKQMFWDVWRFQRDQFYDKNMLGLDWKAIGDKYADLLDNVGNRSDLDYIFGQLIGELGTGHAYVSPGPAPSDPMTPGAGLLGADYEAVGNKVKITKVYPGVDYVPDSRGPLGAIGVDVKDGDYLLEIDGEAVTAKSGVTQHLIGKVGRRVEIKVNSTTSLDGARTYHVYPAFSENNLRYETWVDERRQMVYKASNGRLGYMHVPDTSVSGIILFLRGFIADIDKEGFVVDERYNGGGFIPTFFIDYLAGQVSNVIAPRHGVDVGLKPSALGPKAMLVNGYAGSGGDLLPYLFRREKLGPLIGTRTWGGLVGIQGTYGLADGGGVTSPAFGIYDPVDGKWIAENTGVTPDVVVDDRPDLVAKGQDPQLSKAIDYLMGELKNRKKMAPRPAAPKVGGF
jgi:tricorn protease